MSTGSGRPEDLDRFLDGCGAMSPTRVLARDEAETFPSDALDELHRWGFSRWLVPARDGGALDSHVEACQMLRVVARRDMTVAIALGVTYVAGIHVWTAGSPEQRALLAELLLDGRLIAFGLTEREHGSDILASEVTASRVGDEWRLDGEKWLINNASRASAHVVYARTGAPGDPRGGSLFLVAGDGVVPGDRIPTLGVRAADIGSVRFSAARGTLLGAAGHGAEIALKGLSVTRLLCSGLSLGIGDAALRIVDLFARSRRLYGGLLIDIPHARQTLADAAMDLSVCECLAVCGARALHFAPRQAAVWSAVCKYLVPATVDAVLGRLAVVLGARHYLREGSEGMFQKLLRDHALVGLFDGSSVINLNALAAQMSFRGRVDAGIFAWDQPLPAFEASRVAVYCRDAGGIFEGMPDVPGMHRLRTAVAALEAEVAAMPPSQGSAFTQSHQRIEAARRYCSLFAAAACVRAWDASRFADPAWLEAALERLMPRGEDFSAKVIREEPYIGQSP